MKVTEDQINSIVDKVVASLEGEQTQSPRPKISYTSPKPKPTPTVSTNGLLGAFADIDSAIKAAELAFEELKETSVETRKKMIEAIREICRENVKELSLQAREETGLGRYEDKIKKNLLAINKTPGVEDLDPIVFTGDNGITLLERSPFGVIGSITPCTNPSETVINNGISMLAAGNTVCFHPHPSAKKVSAFTVHLLNKAVMGVGGPSNIFTTVVNPTIESAQKLMVHPDIHLLAVTGGPAVVGVAMKSGKRVIAAGPGNPPVVVDETADIDQAAKDIITSASTDNNIICVIEKEIIVVEKVAEQLKQALIKHGAVNLTPYQTKRLEQLVVDGNHANKKYVGKDIQVILRDIGMEVDESKRLSISDVPGDHPFATVELLMPVLPFIRVKNIDEAIDLAYKLEGGCGHTAAIHSKNIDNMHKMAVKMNTSIFVKNGPCLAGLGFTGEGSTSFTIASPTGEGVTTARHFTRTRRCVLKGYFGSL